MPADQILNLETIVTEVLARAPDWLRRDLAGGSAPARQQAEEALAAMLTAAIRAGSPALK